MAAQAAQNIEPVRVSKSVIQLVREAVRRFDLIEPGDRIAVGISGGKDSLLLAAVLGELQRHDDLDFELQLIHLDQNQPGFDRDGFQRGLDRLGMECRVIDKDTHSVVQSLLKPGQIPCSICGRMRRGILNKYCADNGFTKLALGHHLDDAVETFFLNLFFGRKLDPLKAATPASAVEVTTIRPLILVEERKIIAWIEEQGVPTVACPVCDTFPESQRREIKEMVVEMQGRYPQMHESVRAALYG
ncbi:MAG: ATP-binding protein [Bradymonadaceae bacterium]